MGAGSEISITGCSSGFNFQHPYGGSELMVTLVLVNLVPLLVSLGTMHISDVYARRKNNNMHESNCIQFENIIR